MNPCKYCGELPQVTNVISVPLCVCVCGYTTLELYWNEHNPLPEPDPLAIAHEQLAECYELLDGIVKRHVAGHDIVVLANDLLTKHREANNA